MKHLAVAGKLVCAPEVDLDDDSCTTFVESDCPVCLFAVLNITARDTADIVKRLGELVGAAPRRKKRNG